ncbi:MULTISPECIES: hypothetical protein [Streptomyces]|uniref:Urocanate hydratase n=1 Tax=Streptomyces xiamenensis TaxID=408015 RepID=A0A0F7CPC2_9ACTN|nr:MULTISPECIES: hypothetical protein [Streptomyces]AKG44406.1 urocanate hydratase [Streptomyces xiamenensis]MCU4747562.1 hypothetical protein [Streptomyces sp. G-5]
MSVPEVVEITAETVLVGDVIQVGGRALVVADLVLTTRGGRRLEFATGEALTLHARSRLTGTRLSNRGRTR